MARRLYFSFGSLLALLLILIAVAYFNFSRLAEANRWNIHSYEVLIQIRNLSSSVFYLKRDTRNFASAGDAKLAQTLAEDRSDFLRDFSETSALVRDSWEQQERLRNLQRIYQRWGAEYLDPLLTARQRRPGAAGTQLPLARPDQKTRNKSKRHLNVMRAILKDMKEAETGLLKTRAKRAASLQRATAATLLGGGIFAILLAVALSMLLARNMAVLATTNVKLTREAVERAQAQEALRRANDELDVRVQQRTHELAQVNATLQTDIVKREQTEERLRDSRARLRALSAHVESVREEERTRIAREIHDQLGQALTGLRMDLAWLEKALRQAVLNAGPPTVGLSSNGANRTGPAPALQKIAAMAQLVDGTIHLVGEIAAAMRPPALDDLGLVAAIEWQAQEFQQRSGITCNFTADVRHNDFDPEVAIGVFRIFQESLTNIARHAEATHVESSLLEQAGDLILTVADNGKGIAAGDLANQKSLGLLGMRERALLLGGEVRLSRLGDSETEGKGTAMVLRVPLAERQSTPSAVAQEHGDDSKSG